MADMQAYLAKHYLSGPKADAILAREEAAKAGRKKKKRKIGEGTVVGGGGAGGGLIVDDDVGTGWGKLADEETDLAPAVEERNLEFRGKAKSQGSSSWSVIRPGDGSRPTPAAKEEDASVPEDERPQVVGAEADEPPAFTGGLQSAAAVKAQAEAQKAKREAAKRERAARKAADEEEEGEETVYRDASGRQIDTKQARAEEKRRKAKELEAQMMKMEWGKGLAQREDVEAKKAELAKMAARPFARHADDAEMNDELKDVERWNDPAAAFLTKATTKSKKPSRPKYQGPVPPPNRYGIPPGYRWDGVDRSNGFEKQFAQKANERKRNHAAFHDWSVSDM